MSILKKGFYASQSTAANYLTFSSDAPFSIKFNEKRWDGVLEYSPDTQNWYEWDASEISSGGNVLYLRGLGNTVITGVNTVNDYIVMTSPTNSDISCTGNIMTLLDHVSPETAQMGTACFAGLFRGSVDLISAPTLPAMTLAELCYANLFSGCVKLRIPPKLPATTLAVNCYRYMFYGSGITTAPELPAMTLAPYCYYYMFNGCTNIKISSTQEGIYQKPWRIPTVGTGTDAANWNTYMLFGTRGTFRANPSINTTYYQAN